MYAMSTTTPATDTEGTRLALAEQLAAAEQDHMKARATLERATSKTAAALEQARAEMDKAALAHRAAAEELQRADAANQHQQTRLQKQLRALTPAPITNFVKQCHDEAARLRERGPRSRKQETGRRWTGGPPEVEVFTDAETLERRLIGLRDAWHSADELIFAALTDAQLEAELARMWEELPALEMRKAAA